LEPDRLTVIRAPVAGQVTGVLAREGTIVAAGAPLLRLENPRLQQEANQAQADLSVADADLRRAQFSYAGLGAARAERTADFERNRSLGAQVSALVISSPITGTLVTPELENLTGSFVTEGATLAEVDDLHILVARIFVPEFEIQKVLPEAACSLKLESLFFPIRSKVGFIAPAPSEIAPGLILQEKYKGTAPPRYYLATALVENPGELRPGMSGDAKIRVGRRSIAGSVLQTVSEFGRRKLW